MKRLYGGMKMDAVPYTLGAESALTKTACLYLSEDLIEVNLTDFT